MADPTSIGEVFELMAGAFKPEAAAGVDAVFQYSISGDAGGDWHIIVKDRKCKINEGLAEAPTVTLILSDEDFIKLITKELNPMTAYTTGKLKIEGDMFKAQLMGQLFEEQQG